MSEATGSWAWLANYSRYLTGRRPGEPPPTLFEYVPDNALVFADESHVTVPQIGGMFKGDFRRKATLAEYGFRLPSCMDNRPLRFEEWDAMRPQTLAVSATPSHWEMNEARGVFVEQVIRPTGLIDPPVEIRPARTQVDDLAGEIGQVALAFGADDMGSIMIEENVVSAAGTTYRASTEDFVHTIRNAGYRARQRDTLYRPVRDHAA